MINVSQAYTDLMKSPIRPKVQPVITVSGIDNEGNEVFLKWEAKNIKDLKYKREIDPIGRTLPYMELTWTEIYRDKMSLENYPEKYKNIVKHMKVELSFVQDLAFFSSWKTIFKSERTWKQIFEEGKTWRDLKNKVDTETITLPSMFLTARPTIEGKTIKWTARDLLYFLDEKQTAYFAGPIPFVNPLKYLLLNARGAFLKSRDIFDALTRTANGITGFEALENEKVIFDDSTKNTLKNYANLRNAYWDFSGDVATLNNFYHLYGQGVYTFSGNLLMEYPKLTQGTDVSQYSFKRYRVYEDAENVYEKSGDEFGTLTVKTGATTQGISFTRYLYDGYGVVKDGDGVFGAVNYAITTVSRTISVTPIKKRGFDNYISNEFTGEPFTEDNPVNPYSSSDSFATERANAIFRYFSSSNYAMEFKCLPNLALTTGDNVWVFTNLYDETGARFIKQGIIVSIELEYNGALKQKLIVHEG